MSEIAISRLFSNPKKKQKLIPQTDILNIDDSSDDEDDFDNINNTSSAALSVGSPPAISNKI